MNGILCHVTWNNHSSTFLNFLSTLHAKDVFCDATIVCHGKYYPVHQLVLSTCSEYFQEIFEHTKCKHPFIIIKDIKPTEFEALLSYMYKGKVNVPEEKLSLFIKAAEGLKVKGLAAPDDPPKQTPDCETNKRSPQNVGNSPQVKKRKLSESPKANKPHIIVSPSIESSQRAQSSQAVSTFESSCSNQVATNSVPLFEQEESASSHDDNVMQQLSEHVEDQQCLEVENIPPCIVQNEVIDVGLQKNTPTDQQEQIATCKEEQITPPQKKPFSFGFPNRPASSSLQGNSQLTPHSSSVNYQINKVGETSTSSTMEQSGSPSRVLRVSSTNSPKEAKEMNPKLEVLSPGKNRMDPKSVSPLNPMVRLNPMIVEEYTSTVREKRDGLSEDVSADSDSYSMGDSETSDAQSREETKLPRSLTDIKNMSEGRRDSLDSLEDVLYDSSTFIEPRACRKDKFSAFESGSDQRLQIYNLNHIPLNNVFTYRVFRNVNLFIEYLLKDNKKEDSFAKSLISIFKCYVNYNRICDNIMNTFDENTSEDMCVWIKSLAHLDPPLFGKHIQYDSTKEETLFSNDVIPALMVIWQFRHLISKHCLVKDLTPGLTATPRQRFIKGIQQNSRSFQKEKLCIFKSHLRTFYRYSLSEKKVE